MLNAFVAALHKQFPNINSSTPGLLAVSGGVDSMVLSHLMHRSGFPFAIAHCNFHLRPGDCDRDEQFVRQWAQQHGVSCYVAQFDTAVYAAKEHLSIEEAARNLRYAFFEDLCAQYHFAYIATAHHLNDAEETFFINLLRGTGLGGLRGIPQVNGRVIRPLLSFTRQQIAQYAEQNNIDYVEDVTNAELLYLRNKVRHQLLPLLRSFNPAFDQVMQRNMQHIDDAYQIVQDSVIKESARLLHRTHDVVTIDIEDAKKLRPLTTWLYEILRPFGFQPAVVENLCEHMEGESGKFFYSPSYRLLKDRSQLIITPIVCNGDKEQPRITIESMDAIDTHDAALGTGYVVVDADAISFPLRLRHWHEADRFQPFGMGHSQLVSDYFSDHKFSRIDKERIWLLVDASDRIVWIVGWRADDRFRVTNYTSKLLKIIVAG